MSDIENSKKSEIEPKKENPTTENGQHQKKNIDGILLESFLYSLGIMVAIFFILNWMFFDFKYLTVYFLATTIASVFLIMKFNKIESPGEKLSIKASLLVPCLLGGIILFPFIYIFRFLKGDGATKQRLYCFLFLLIWLYIYFV